MIEMKMVHADAARVDVTCTFEGGTDTLLDELAAGMAHMVIRIADDLPVVDDIHESLARVMASKMIDIVLSELDLREEQSPSPTDRAARDKPTEA